MSQPDSRLTDQQPTNVISVVGFIVALLGFNVVAVILGFIGLNQIKRTGERGRGFALAAIWIGILVVIIGVILAIVLLAASAGRTTEYLG